MVRPACPVNWNRRNRLMNRQGTVWNRPEPNRSRNRSRQVPNGTGTGWNRTEPDGTGPTQTVAMPKDDPNRMGFELNRGHLSISSLVCLPHIFFRPHSHWTNSYYMKQELA